MPNPAISQHNLGPRDLAGTGRFRYEADGTDIERLTRRLRSVSQRLEGIEDSLDRLEERVGSAAAASAEDRGDTSALEVRLDEIARDIAALRSAVAPEDEPMPRAQERLTVTQAAQ